MGWAIGGATGSLNSLAFRSGFKLDCKMFEWGAILRAADAKQRSRASFFYTRNEFAARPHEAIRQGSTFVLDFS